MSIILKLEKIRKAPLKVIDETRRGTLMLGKFVKVITDEGVIFGRLRTHWMTVLSLWRP
ncbi:hypothetical protein [Thermococcus gorgonarius]|uniref:hypothetical protein n=1 Tax=Thermococcus gorgonarius TaxID=71997 RepID=UPI0012FD19AA|nr:hypothetical protein [Thermococcus gorgonarius]